MKKLLRIIELIKSKKVYYVPFVYFGIVLLACSPVIIAMSAGFFGSCLGCNINEARTDNCILLGIPFGSALNIMGAFFWFALITIPVGIIAIIAWTIYCILILVRDKKKQSSLEVIK